MKTNNIDLLKMVPIFMRSDKFVIALAESFNDVLNRFELKKLRTWDQLQKMNHRELDELAWELNVLWYNKDGTLAQKRAQIISSNQVWSRLGTRYAVETVIREVFGSGEVLEFWEIENGLPHHFEVVVSDPRLVTPEGEAEFRRLLEKVKRKSQILDRINLVMDEVFNLHLGIVHHEVTRETITFG